MNGNRLKINKDKTQFVWLGTPHQLSRIRCQKITFGGADIQISTEAMCLGVLLDSRLTFAPHIRRISGRCFYHLRQLRVVRKSLTVEAAKTMVHSFVVAVPRCNLARYGQRSFYVSGPSLWNVELSAADCSWFVTDSNTVLYEAKDISVYSSLRDITIAPPWQPRL